MKAGFFECDITPEIGSERVCHYCKLYIKGTHDPLKVRAMIVQETDESEPVAVVSVDTALIKRDFVTEARTEVAARTGIPAERIMIAATHTHSGGSLWGFIPDDLKDAPELVRELALKHSPSIDPEYRKHVVDAVVTSVSGALQRIENALLSVGSGTEDMFIRNRRFRMKNGKTWTHPGKGLAREIVSPAGPVDPGVGALGMWRDDGKLLGCVVNYSCHATTMEGEAASADYVAYIESTIRKIMGEQAIIVFLNGACGDVTQIDNLSDREPELGEKYAEMLGVRVGAEAVKILVSSERSGDARIGCMGEVLEIKRRVQSPRKLILARETVERKLRGGHERLGKAVGKGLNEQHDTEWLLAKERVILDYISSVEPDAKVEVQVLQIGSVVFACNPAEFFCGLGLEIKKNSHFPFTFVVELANGCAGYVPAEKDFGAGGYETILTAGSNLEPAAGSKIVSATLELIKCLVPEEAPLRPPADLTGSRPWEMGMAEPELE